MRSGTAGVIGSAGDMKNAPRTRSGCSTAQQQRGARGRAVADDDGVGDAGRVEHGERVLRRHARAVLLGALGPVG